MRRRRLGSQPHVVLPPNDTHLQGESPQIDATHVHAATHNVTIFADGNVPQVLTRSNSVTAKSKLSLHLLIIF